MKFIDTHTPTIVDMSLISILPSRCKKNKIKVEGLKLGVHEYTFTHMHTNKILRHYYLDKGDNSLCRFTLIDPIESLNSCSLWPSYEQFQLLMTY